MCDFNWANARYRLCVIKSVEVGHTRAEVEQVLNSVDWNMQQVGGPKK